MLKILIADDDQEVRNLLKNMLADHQVSEVENGQEAVAAVCATDFALVILDVMIPIMDGYQACEEIRKISNVPILFLTTKGQEYDEMLGFSNVDDDYLIKPFVPSELLTKVNTMLKQYYGYRKNDTDTKDHVDPIIQIGDLVINQDIYKVSVDGKDKNLTALEFRILLLFCKANGKVFSAQQIYESIWEKPYSYTENQIMMTHIRKLREKLEQDPQNPRYIKTVWGMGYKIDY